MPYELRDELTVLDPEAIHLHVDAFDDLILVSDGETQRVESVLRAFPVSAEHRFIVLRAADATEIGVIPDLTALDAESRRAVQTKLDLAYFTARITALNAIWEEYHIPHWDVDTDRGPRIFQIGSTRRDIRLLAGGRVLIRDADGNRYEIPDHRELDAFSQALIETIL